MNKNLTKKPKKSKKIENMTFQDVRNVEEGFLVELKNNPKFSLEVDPFRKYDLTELDVEFIKLMVQYKNVNFVAKVMMHIDIDEAIQMYKRYEIEEEIKRINLALYARRFCSKMADLDALGGYLTTALTDENVPIADRLSGKDKLAAVKLLIDINKMKADIIEHPEAVDATVIEAEIKKLNVKDIEKLIENSDDDDKILQKKNELISKIDKDNMLTQEEVTYLRTQTLDDLKKLVKEIEGGLKNEGK